MEVPQSTNGDRSVTQNAAEQYLSFLASRDAKDEPERQATTVEGANARVMRELALVHDAAVRLGHDMVDSGRLHRPPRTAAFIESLCSNDVEGMYTAPTLIYWAVEKGEMALVPPETMPDVIDVQNLMNAIERQLQPPALDEVCSWDQFERELLEHHGRVFRHRGEMQPGGYKTRENRVGGHLTVPCDQVRATLQAGFGAFQKTHDAFAREAMMEYLIVATHPFRDGNGRMSRLLANGEATRRGRQRMVVVPAWWDQYLVGLRRIRALGEADTWVKERIRISRANTTWDWHGIASCLRDLHDGDLIEDWPHDRPEMVAGMRRGLISDMYNREYLSDRASTAKRA